MALDSTNSLSDPSMQRLSETILSTMPDPAKLRQLDPSRWMLRKHVFGPLEELAKRADELFKGKEISLDDPEQFDFITKGFVDVINKFAEDASKLPPNVIATCSVSEAAFSSADNRKPIVATDGLATCIGVAAYDRTNKQGFVVHFARDDEVVESGNQLIETLLKSAEKPIETPVEVHLRGGIAGLSVPLAEEIERWVESAAKKGCPMKIVSSEILLHGLFNDQGMPNLDSLSLDTRDGSVSSYDREKNPYAEPRKQIQNAKEADELFSDALVRCIQRKPEITIVYQ